VSRLWLFSWLDDKVLSGPINLKQVLVGVQTDEVAATAIIDLQGQICAA